MNNTNEEDCFQAVENDSAQIIQGNDSNYDPSSILNGLMTGEDNTDTYKEGMVDNYGSSTEATSTGAAATNNTVASVIGVTRETTSMIYNKLTTSFQPLAEDISKHPELANMLHGFIRKAQNILSDTKSSRTKQAFIQLLTSRHSQDTDSNAIENIPGHSNPIRRPHAPGRPKTKRYQSFSESIKNSLKRSRPAPLSQDELSVHVKPKEPCQCGYSGLQSGH